MRQSLFSTRDGKGNGSVRIKVVAICEHNDEVLFATAERGSKPEIRVENMRIRSRKDTTLDRVFSPQSSWAPPGAMASQNRVNVFEVQLSSEVREPIFEMISGLLGNGVVKRDRRHIVVSINCLLRLNDT